MSTPTLTLTLKKRSGGGWEVIVPDLDGGEYARTWAADPYRAVAEAAHYVAQVALDANDG